MKNLKLTNIRVTLQNYISAGVFSKALLGIGIPVDPSTGLISFPPNFCHSTRLKDELLSKVFLNIDANYINQTSKRVILVAINKGVDDLNTIIQSQINGQIHSFKSIDYITDPNEVVNYPTEVLNSLGLPGLPPHKTQLKVGSAIIMPRNLNQPKFCKKKFL